MEKEEKGTGGRPRSVNKRTNTIKVSLNDQEYGAAEANADLIGFEQLAPYLRYLHKNFGKNISVVSKSDKVTVASLQKIGVNINQIAKRVNEGQAFNNSDALETQLESAIVLLREVIQGLR